MALLSVLDDGHLKLPRQADDRGRGQECENHPARSEDLAGAGDCLGGHVSEDVAEPVRHGKGDEHAHSDQCEELTTASSAMAATTP